MPAVFFGEAPLVELSRRRLELAVHHQQAGRTRQAIAIYQELLQKTPRDADLVQRLGVAFAQVGAHAEGARLLAASLELNPDQPSVLLNLARALLALNRREDALACCDRVLSLDARSAAAHRLRGTALAALGRNNDALASFSQAVRLAPEDAGALTDLGVALAQANRVHDAMLCFERAVALNPREAPAHHNLALLAVGIGDHPRALTSLERGLELQPGNVALHVNRGVVLLNLGRLTDSLQSLSMALSIDPLHVDATRNRAVVNLMLQNHAHAVRDYEQARALGPERPQDLIGCGAALLALNRNPEALALLEKAAALAPDDLDAQIQFGVALLRLERYAEAIEWFDRALTFKPRRPEVLNNRGVAAVALGRMNEALENFIESAANNGGIADTQTNIGVVFKSLGNHRQAGLAFDRALSLKRDDAAASFELAFLHLTMGEFRKGWPLYEARFRVPALKIPSRNVEAPQWDGRSSLEGKTILVHAEQGLGDTIQFSRYLPLLKDKGASVVFEVMPQLVTLLSSLPATPKIVARGQSLPPFDFHCPLLSLPLAFDTQLSTVPHAVPYLSSDPVRATAWADRLQQVRGLRIGIAWQGSVEVERLIWARGRSMPLNALAPLSELPGVSLISLQKGPGLDQLRAAAFRDRIVDLGPQFDSGSDAFLDSAAVMTHLDLVITSDSAIAHLAGALGVPVWVALHAAADWRWLLERDDSPWYPTMRLFRQRRDDNGWDIVVANLCAAVKMLTSKS